jgi:hypothetical protein
MLREPAPEARVPIPVPFSGCPSVLVSRKPAGPFSIRVVCNNVLPSSPGIQTAHKARPASLHPFRPRHAPNHMLAMEADVAERPRQVLSPSRPSSDAISRMASMTN